METNRCYFGRVSQQQMAVAFMYSSGFALYGLLGTLIIISNH